MTSVQVASSRSGQVEVSWTRSDRAHSFEIDRDGSIVARLSAGSDHYRDERLGANKTYSYRVIGLSQADTVVSSSRTVAIDPDGPTGSGGTGGKLGTRINWPCTGCIISVPRSYNPHIPTALLVALHGDEGVSYHIASTWMPVTEQANVILFAPQCPTNHGCHVCVERDCSNSWWYWFQASHHYDDVWIAQQVRVIESKYNVDRAREYITGWSGGADYLGWYALTHASRFAAANFVAGGVPYTSACPSRKLAAYFLMGSKDFRYLTGQPSEVRAIMRRCGDPTRMVVLRGETTTARSVPSRPKATQQEFSTGSCHTSSREASRHSARRPSPC